MANKFVTAIFGDYSKKEVKKLRKTVDKINELSDKYAEMDDKELSSQTELLKERLADGETKSYREEDKEYALVILGGKCTVSGEDFAFENAGKRNSRENEFYKMK